MNLIYRTATLKDKHKLLKLGLSAYGQFKDVLTPDNWAKMNSFLTTDDSYSDLLSISTCFVCELDNELVGMAYLVGNGNATEIFDADWSYIRMVGVEPRFSGNGIGKKLTQMCISNAVRTKEHTIALHTSEFMNAARHVYESLGFKQIRELNPLFGKRYWLYQLNLTGSSSKET